MPSLKDLRNRIASVRATQKITKAMQMVAAAKLRRAQGAVEAARPYGQRMAAMLKDIAKSGEGQDNLSPLLAGNGKNETHLLVVATAERGLCGGFNASIARRARLEARRLIREGRNVKIYCVGKKGQDALKSEFAEKIIKFTDLRAARQVEFHHAKAISEEIEALFQAGQFDICTLYYARFKSVINQIPSDRQLVPADLSDEENGDGEISSAQEDVSSLAPDYEPDRDELLDALLPRNLAVQIFLALLENAASEQGARMSAMDNATRNAGEMIGKLTLSYNRQRQAQITRELIEIISGAEAL